MKNIYNVHNSPGNKNRNYVSGPISCHAKDGLRVSRRYYTATERKHNVPYVSQALPKISKIGAGMMSGAIYKLYHNALVKKVPVSHGVVHVDNGRMLIVITPPDSGIDMAVILEPNDEYSAKKTN